MEEWLQAFWCPRNLFLSKRRSSPTLGGGVGVYLDFCDIAGQEERLGPVAVREFNGARFALDGHHRLVIADYLKRTSRLYLAESRDDFLQPEQAPLMAVEGILRTNQCISSCFESIERFVRRERKLHLIHDLQMKYRTRRFRWSISKIEEKVRESYRTEPESFPLPYPKGY